MASADKDIESVEAAATGSAAGSGGAEQFLKVNVSLSWHLIWIFALLEGITVPLVPLFLANGPSVNKTAGTASAAAQSVSFAKNLIITGIYGTSIGFIGTLTICLLLNYFAFRRLAIHLTDAVVIRVIRPYIVGLWGGLLLASIFWMQQCIGSLLIFSMMVNLMIFGFVSAASAVIITGIIYSLVIRNFPYLGIQLLTSERQVLLAKFPIISFAVLVGLYEGLAMPILHIWVLVPHYKVLIALLVGVSGGALSSFIVVALAHIRIVDKHMWLEFSTVPKGATRLRPRRHSPSR